MIFPPTSKLCGCDSKTQIMFVLIFILSYLGKLFYSLKCLYKRSHLCKRKRKLSKYFFAVACKKYVCVAVTNYVLQSKKVIKYVNENDFILC